MPTSFKPVFQMRNDPVWYDNAQRFATKEEALASAESRFARWTAPAAFAAHESDDPVNYTFVDGMDQMVNRPPILQP